MASRAKLYRSQGIACPSCGSTSTAVAYTRHRDSATIRGRKCACGHRFSTRETVIGGNYKSVPEIMRDLEMTPTPRGGDGMISPEGSA